MKKEIRFYNMLFPLWLVMAAPLTWVAVIPANFLIDSLVLMILLFACRVEEKRRFYIGHILPVWGFGFLADIIASAGMLLAMFLGVGGRGDEWYLTVPGLLAAAGLIFVFNYFISFRREDRRRRFRMTLFFAVFTAPYTFLVPTGWISG
ncbi:MAG: hypothetical protein IJC15_01940 [Clostridia bacterium]|nr:hypothetical protein [Clostridia bacterium]